ncbi:MAG: tetratricopeptide repeat protein [Clostridium sp.]|nr:tetratricopeptide repeat protein [Clostridium sp.]
MNTESIIEEIKKQLTGDPQKDGPFLKDQSEKYKNEENSAEINRELATLLYECAYNAMTESNYEYLADKNPLVREKLENVLKRYKNLNYAGGLKILEEIIKDNIFAWVDNDKITYKSFGTPIEHALYMQIYHPEKEVRPVNCNMSEVYSLYGLGLAHKKQYAEAIEAFRKALEFNPTDAEIYVRYCELLKAIKQNDELRINTDKLMNCAVTKEQLGKGYFNYSYYFSEKKAFKKAAAMLEMSRIFLSESKLIDDEKEFISSRLNGSYPPPHTKEQLMDIMIDEKIQPGPSVLVVSTANFLAKHAQQELDFELAKYFYETVFELTELDEIREKIECLENDIRNMKKKSKNKQI